MTQATGAPGKTCKSGHGVDANRVFCPECGRVGTFEAKAAIAPAGMMSQRALQSSEAHDSAMRARNALRGCWVIGLALTLLGGVIAGMTIDDSSLEDLAFAITHYGVGQILLLVAIIGTGVRLGVNSANSRLHSGEHA